MAAVSLTLGSNEYPLTVVDGTALTLSLSGPTGPAGPNTVSTSTSTNLTGYIYGNGTTVGGATEATSAATANTLVLRNAGGGVAVSTINNLAITAAANSTLSIDEDKGITLFDSITTEFGGYINTDVGGYIVTGVNGNITTGAGGYIQTGIGGHISTTAGGSFTTGTGNLTGPNASGTVPVYTGTPATGQVLTASGTAGLTNWTSATPVATANTLVLRDASGGGVSFQGGSGDGANIQSTSGRGVFITSQTATGAEIFSDSGTGADIFSTSGSGARIESGSGTGANIIGSSGTYHAQFGNSGINQSFIARVKGALGWIRGAYTGRIHPPDTLTADRTYTLPNASGTVALIDPSTGTQTFSGAQTFTNSAIGTGTGVAISGTATSGTILAVSGTASTSGSLFTVTQGSIGFRITETGALSYNGAITLGRPGGVDISLGGVNNANTFRSNNTGSNTATDFVLRGGTADRTAGNLFQVQNFTQPVLTISALTGTGNVGIGTTTPAEKLSVVGNATVSGSLTVSGSTQFASTTRPTSSGTGTPAATSLITLADVEGRFGPRGKYDLDPQTVVLQQTLNTATAPVLGGRFGSTYSFAFGSPAGNPAGVVFVPFYITKIRTYTKCAIAITAGTSVADVLYGGIYLPDASGFPKTRLGDVWQWSCASVSNLVEATINVGAVSELFYVALLPSKGAADWVINNGTNLVVRATDQAGANAGFREVFNACPRDLSANVGAFGILATGGISSLPADMSSPEVRRPSSYSAVTHPVCILY